MLIGVAVGQKNHDPNNDVAQYYLPPLPSRGFLFFTIRVTCLTTYQVNIRTWYRYRYRTGKVRYPYRVPHRCCRLLFIIHYTHSLSLFIHGRVPIFPIIKFRVPFVSVLGPPNSETCVVFVFTFFSQTVCCLQTIIIVVWHPSQSRVFFFPVFFVLFRFHGQLWRALQSSAS